MTVEIKGKWNVYPSGWPLIGKVRNIYYFTIRNVDKKKWGYSYDEYEGFTFNSFELGFIGISWGTGYECHKDNRQRDGSE